MAEYLLGNGRMGEKLKEKKVNYRIMDRDKHIELHLMI
jgi:hypothetical protein